MPRVKKYNEQAVVEKAMNLFWKNGYENTSMQMLEKEMGINKFSIYSSFKSKHGLFLESLKNYKKRISFMFDELKKSPDGIESIKKFFYDSIKITQLEECQNGCLITNTYHEFSEKEDEIINKEMTHFMDNLKELFIEKLSIDKTKNRDNILKQANFLLLAKHGLVAASKVNTKKEIEDYIEMTFKNL